MKKWSTELFQYGDDLVVVYQKVICMDDINECIYIATKFIKVFGIYGDGKEEKFKPFPSISPMKCGIIGYNIMPYQKEYCVCPFSPLPNPDFPKKGNERDDENDDENNEDDVMPPRHQEYTDLNDRVASFLSWPHQNPSPQTLAQAGFYYVRGTTDTVRCFSCDLRLEDFHPNDDPLKVHSEHFPNCQHLRNIIGTNIEKRLVSSSFYDVFQLQKKKVKPYPRNPQFTTLQARIESYRNWPSNATQTPRALAEAGLYYAGVDDQVRCFCCDGGLCQWEPQDDPWAEHCHWFPNCPFAIAEKGTEYIARVLAEREMEAYDMNGDFDDGTIQVENEIHHYLPMMQSIFQLSEQPNDEQDIDTLLQENKRLKRESLCSECQDNGRNALFLPCTHRVMCMSCASICKHCPRCRREIKNKIQTYLC